MRPLKVSRISDQDQGQKLEVYRRMLLLNPRDIATRYLLVLELERLGCYDEAISELQTILRFDANNLPAREAMLRIKKKG